MGLFAQDSGAEFHDHGTPIAAQPHAERSTAAGGRPEVGGGGEGGGGRGLLSTRLHPMTHP
jgi:hypothetical protein